MNRTVPISAVKRKRERTNRKSSSNAFLRYSICAIVAIVIPSLIYVNLSASKVEIIPHPSVVFKKNLEAFRGNSSLSNLISNNNKTNFDVQEKKRPGSDAPAFVDHNIHDKNLILTAYLEPPESLIETGNADDPWIRNTSSANLRSVSFPTVSDCTTLMQDFPVNDFPLEDPFLPWIHDYFPSLDGKSLHFIAQNKRKCDSGRDHVSEMEFWTPQVSLFQGIPLVVEESSPGITQESKRGIGNNEKTYRFASTLQEATHNSTRFQCRFHRNNMTVTTLSVYPFDYEFLTEMKGYKSILSNNGDSDRGSFFLNQLLFSCPIPEIFQPLLSSENEINNRKKPAFHIDLIPIRTPVRSNFLFRFSTDKSLEKEFGKSNVLPPMDDAGRWENLPVCRRLDDLLPRPGKRDRDQPNQLSQTNSINIQRKPHRLVACTWTSSSYRRRGESYSVSDSVERLKEWIQFHLMVGFDHLYIYDNTDTEGNSNSSVLLNVTQSFGNDQVTYHAWPCKICNNNRPAQSSPGVRSSQYAAENSCRIRYGELSEWMAFIDTDEYLVPMKQKEDGEYSWHPIMNEMEEKNISIMKLRSSKAKPRINLTETLKDQSACAFSEDTKSAEDPRKKTSQSQLEPCVGPMKNKTFLQVYNCEYIRPPKPKRFNRAMKQIYRPSFVLLHFVHYSTVTTITRTHTDFERSYPGENPRKYGRNPHSEELFLDDMTQGALVHTRSVLPHETRKRSSECSLNSSHTCVMGFLCEDNVEFVDELHQKNVFHNSDGGYCNCWKNNVIEDILVPKLESLLQTNL